MDRKHTESLSEWLARWQLSRVAALAGSVVLGIRKEYLRSTCVVAYRSESFAAGRAVLSSTQYGSLHVPARPRALWVVGKACGLLGHNKIVFVRLYEKGKALVLSIFYTYDIISQS